MSTLDLTWQDVLNLVLGILFVLSETLPFMESLQGNGLIHALLTKKVKKQEENHLSKDESQ
jgi:hypothetical protein